jgi:hydroxypyruvate reductase
LSLTLSKSISVSPLREPALHIWRAGVDAVRAERLVHDAVRVEGDVLKVRGQRFPLPTTGRLVVVGAGKAGAGMACALEAALADWRSPAPPIGWVNVPADCVRPTQWIHLHPARPPGVNAPTAAAVSGTERILELVAGLGPEDVCIALISGGGSALLTAPIDGVSLPDKQLITRSLSERGASIEELNCVRRALSQVKGGGLLRACRAGTIIPLVISDVAGDPLATIASGPLVPNPTTAADALSVLRRFAPDRPTIRDTVWRVLEAQSPSSLTSDDARLSADRPPIEHFIIGNNRTACEAAAAEARRLGYEVVAVRCEERGVAREIGAAFAEELQSLRDCGPTDRPRCVITGGEPIVQLNPSSAPRKGGRNQEFVLAAAERLWGDGIHEIAILSGGTDGEDGPTDAAGAVVDEQILLRAKSLGLEPAAFLEINNSYPFWEQAGGLILTGPTHTNVMDLRIGLVGQ